MKVKVLIKHSNLPFTIHKTTNAGRLQPIIIRSGEDYVGEVGQPNYSDIEWKPIDIANAEFIKSACNSHDAFVEAATELIYIRRNKHILGSVQQLYKQAYVKLDAALKLARG